jgi:hypothetical protein
LYNPTHLGRKVLTPQKIYHLTDDGSPLGQMKVPQKRKLPGNIAGERCNVEVLDYIEILLLSIADSYTRGKP